MSVSLHYDCLWFSWEFYSNIGNVSIGSTRGFDVPLYFELPKQFIGDRLLSYAGRFKFSIEMKECKTELDKLILQQFPLIRIHSHDALILDYFGVSSLATYKYTTKG